VNITEYSCFMLVYNLLQVQMVTKSYIAIGSNLGNRVQNITDALRRLSEVNGIGRISSTGFLYESAPMYLEDQPAFLNTCCEIETFLSPHDLMNALNHIEVCMGRERLTKNGPRIVDLDIIFYGSDVVNDPDLKIPHPRLSEREFVLAPLSDICPYLIHPTLQTSVAEIRKSLNASSTCQRVFPAYGDRSLFRWGSRTFIMGILNVTPDSFSDGGLYNESVEAAVGHAADLVAAGADIVDVGGESTRPKAEIVNEKEEQRRVIDVIRAIRSKFPNLPISVDTYRASTARLAIEGGASIVNDVSGGLLDPDMISTVSSLGVPYICMHAGRVGSHPPLMYGEKSGLLEDQAFSRNLKSALDTVHDQLALRVDACIASGIARWNLVIDPGFGFGKSADVNFALVRHLDETLSGSLKQFPVMVGASRKRFVRDLVAGKDWSGSNEQAMLGTVAVSVAVQDRADIHRVHDVAQLKYALCVSDRVYRQHV
jgi:dihydroneopterin aldolase/2-amino-4-hydroxy-6-hydroxymethyldihydropteridine diphosphokinase/dihydropteroate synthase